MKVNEQYLEHAKAFNQDDFPPPKFLQYKNSGIKWINQRKMNTKY